MAYATQADMTMQYGEQQLIELTDRSEEPVGAVDLDTMNAALDDASAYINSYAASRYKVPISPVPLVLRDVCCVIAYYKLHRGRYADETRAAYDDALKTLTNISNGNQVLDVAGEEPPSSTAQVVQFDNKRQFSRTRGEW